VDFSGSQSLSNEMDRIRFPEPLRKLFEPNRYKILYGGRGGAKSWGVARALLIIGAERPIRVLCAREFQSSISDSVHKLLSDQIELMGYGPGQKNFYEIEKATIKGKNGTEFVFAGIRHNVGRIKSYEGVDIVWVEEAENVSRNSWEVLIPTIRKAGSEIWLTFNPALESDETYQRFVVNPPPGALLLKLNWIDNPWFGGELERERLLTQAT
jgi:phage terminase large subunit